MDKAQESLEALDLDEGLNPETGDLGKIGYTLKAVGAGLWALENAPSYMEGIRAIIHEGGDADSNAAVADSLLGARFGFAQIPPRLVEGLIYKSALESRIEQLMLTVRLFFRPNQRFENARFYRENKAFCESAA